jgi:hypothetical protein
MLGARVAERQLAPAAPAADEACEQGIAMLRCTMVAAGRNVAVDHRADRLGLLPADIALMGTRPQGQPVGARLAADLHPIPGST